jgi:hypothetical protein
MPLTEKGATIKEAMQEHYGSEKGESVFYASKNAGKIKGVDMEQKPKGGIVDAAEAPIVMPAVPVLLNENAQLHPDASTPPEPALPVSRDGGFGQRDAAAGYGGVAGGAMESPFKGAADALPTSISLADIRRTNEGFWPQFKGVE